MLPQAVTDALTALRSAVSVLKPWKNSRAQVDAVLAAVDQVESAVNAYGAEVDARIAGLLAEVSDALAAINARDEALAAAQAEIKRLQDLLDAQPEPTPEPEPEPQPEPEPTPSGLVPVLWCSDLPNGPNTGNSDTSLGQVANENGAIVTIWGANLGKSGEITVCGAPVKHVYYWGPAVAPWCPANLVNGYQDYQCVIFQVPKEASGSGHIVVTVDGQSSVHIDEFFVRHPGLPFTVRAGRIAFVKDTGADVSTAGSWEQPFKTVHYGKNRMNQPGDILYTLTGIPSGDGSGAFMNVAESGTETHPIAIIAYPGVECQIGHLTSTANDVLKHYKTSQWRIYSKFSIFGGVYTTVQERGGHRTVGCKLSAPKGRMASGAGMGWGNKFKYLACEFTDIGAYYESLYHTLYLAGERRGGVNDTYPPETDREIAYCYIHGNKSDTGVQIYNYDDQEPGQASIQRHSVHHCVILDQLGDGVKWGAFCEGENWGYLLVIIRCGRTGMNYRMSTQKVSTFHCTLIECGTQQFDEHPTMGQWLKSAAGAVGWYNAKNNWTGEHPFSNNLIYQVSHPYLAIESTSTNQKPNRTGGHNLWFGRGAAPEWDINPVNADPQFVNLETEPYDLRPKATSPAKGAGLALPDIPFDINGRPFLTRDIGAYASV